MSGQYWQWSAESKTAVFAIASFAPAAVNVSLVVDWAALGLDPAATSLQAPAIAGYQPAHQFAGLGAEVEVEVAPSRGWLIVAKRLPSLV